MVHFHLPTHRHAHLLWALTLALTTAWGQDASVVTRAPHASSATMQGVAQINNLPFSVKELTLLHMIEPVSPPHTDAGNQAITIKRLTAEEWKKSIDELQNLSEQQRKVLLVLLSDIQRKVDASPAKNHDELNAWADMVAGIQYRPPQRQRLKTGDVYLPPNYIGTANATDLSLRTACRYIDFPVTLHPAKTSKPAGIYLSPMFNLVNVPCFGVHIDVQVILKTPADALHTFKKSKVVQMPLTDTTCVASTFLRSGKSPSGFGVFFDDDEITLPAGSYPLNIYYQVYMDEVPVAKSQVFTISYSKR